MISEYSRYVNNLENIDKKFQLMDKINGTSLYKSNKRLEIFKESSLDPSDGAHVSVE